MMAQRTSEKRQKNLHEPTEDYGGLQAMMTIIPKEEAGQPTGFKFMGTPSYDKRGKSKQHEAVTHKPAGIRNTSSSDAVRDGRPSASARGAG